MKLDICLPVEVAYSLEKTLNNIDGVSAGIPSPTMAFDCVPEDPRWFEIIITIAGSAASTIALNLISNAIHDIIKKDSKYEAMIEGNKISGENVTIIQIQNVIINTHANDGRKTND